MSIPSWLLWRRKPFVVVLPNRAGGYRHFVRQRQWATAAMEWKRSSAWDDLGFIPNPRRFGTVAQSDFGSNKRQGPVEEYEKRVSSGLIRDDMSQRAALGHLQSLYDRVLEFEKRRDGAMKELDRIIHKERNLRVLEGKAKEEAKKASSSWFSNFLGGGEGRVPSVNELQRSRKELVKRRETVDVPRGLYMHGGPGSGKTFLMELFHECLPIAGKRRVHFHEFMLEVHRTLHSLQQRGVSGEDMVERCVEALHDQAWVLCFDEFQVTDIADAMIMRRLFEALLAKGMVIVATSNREPDELYKNGIQRDLFLPFIDELKAYCYVVTMQSEIDYRMLLLRKDGSTEDNREARVYFVNDGFSLESSAQFERLWEEFSKGDVVDDCVLRVQGRDLHVPFAGRHADVARFTFDAICGKPLGAADYYAIASTFHTIFIDEVPKLPLSKINQIRRFITLIDTLYDQNVVVILSAQVPMDDLLDKGSFKTEEDATNAVIQETDILGESKYVPSQTNVDEVFAFDRTLSRLHEMQKVEYIEQTKVRESRGPSAVRFFSQLDIHRTQGALSEGDIRQLWDRYDANEDGKIDANELETMLKEFMLFKSGHQHVPRELVESTRQALNMHGDSNSRHFVEWDDFRDYLRTCGLSFR